MHEKSFVSVSLTMGDLSYYYDLSNFAILLVLYHHVGDKFFIFIPLIYYTCTLHYSY